jgi:4-hydroxy-4-methyl-2-oxoglutarate aldolase
MPTKYKIVSDFPRPDPGLVARARNIYVCMVGALVGPRQTMDVGIKAWDRDWRICGPAVTVRPEYVDDTLMTSLAGKYVKPGDVVLVDAGGNPHSAAFGGSQAAGLKEAGATGVVVDGYTLTGEVLRKREGIPVFCRGTVARYAMSSQKPGWINCPIICGGVIVYPGDLIMGDEDGVVVVPRELVADIIPRIEKEAGRPADGSIPPREKKADPYYQRSGAEAKAAKLEDTSFE